MDARFMAIFIAFICVFSANNSEGRRKLGENICDDGVQVFDKHSAEQAWNYCIKELKDNTGAVKDLDSALSHSLAVRNGVEMGSTFSANRIIKKAIGDLPPKEKEAILHCLKKKKFPLQVLKDDQWTLSNNCQNLFSSWAGIPRRYLRRHKGKLRILNTVSSPGPAHGSAPSPVSKSPNHAPVSSSDPSENDYYPTPSDTDYAHQSPDIEKFTPIPSQDDNSNQQYLVAAVVATLLAALGLVTLVLLVWMKRDKRIDPKDGQRDEKPLLNFSASCISAGSSEKSSILGSRNNMQCKTPTLAGGNPLDANCVPSQVGFQSSEAHADTIRKTLLPLPPGRTAPPSAGALVGVGAAPGAVAAAVAALEGAGVTLTGARVAPAGAGVAPVGAGVASMGARVAPMEAGLAAEGAVEAAGAVAPPPPPPGPPPTAPPNLPAPAAPPPPIRFGHRPPPPNPPGPARPSPLGPHHRHTSTGETSECSNEPEAPKTKLKPFFWDKVLASPDHSMVWHEIRAGSFQFNEEMMEALFGCVAADKKKNENKKGSPSESSPQFIQIIDPKKAQNLAILLKALNMTTEEVCDALREGNELPSEFIQTLLKMAPTTEEELKLRLFGGELSQLGPAERFLKVIVDIPFAFKRLESLLFMSTFQEELTSIKDSLATLEVACKELRNSRLFLKLLEAVLKTGNRMNDGTYRGGAQAFKLDTLLKLSDVKGTDGKTTLLHFVVHEIIRGEGLRAARKLRERHSLSSVKTEDLFEDSSHETEEYYRNLGLQVVSGLSNELQNVKKAALIDNEILSESVSKLGQSRFRTKDFLEYEMENSEEESEFCDALKSFLNQSESDITWLIEEEKRIMALVKSTGDYFHGRAGRDEGAHLFVIVRDFLVMVDKSCLDVKNSIRLPAKAPRKDVSALSSPSPSHESPSETPREIHQRLFPAMRERQMDDDDDFNSDNES